MGGISQPRANPSCAVPLVPNGCRVARTGFCKSTGGRRFPAAQGRQGRVSSGSHRGTTLQDSWGGPGRIKKVGSVQRGPQRDGAPHLFLEPGWLGDFRFHRTPRRRFDGVLAEPPLTLPRDTQLGAAGSWDSILWTTCLSPRCRDGATGECWTPPPLSGQSHPRRENCYSGRGSWDHYELTPARPP